MITDHPFSRFQIKTPADAALMLSADGWAWMYHDRVCMRLVGAQQKKCKFLGIKYRRKMPYIREHQLRTEVGDEVLQYVEQMTEAHGFATVMMRSNCYLVIRRLRDEEGKLAYCFRVSKFAGGDE